MAVAVLFRKASEYSVVDRNFIFGFFVYCNKKEWFVPVQRSSSLPEKKALQKTIVNYLDIAFLSKRVIRVQKPLGITSSWNNDEKETYETPMNFVLNDAKDMKRNKKYKKNALWYKTKFFNKSAFSFIQIVKKLYFENGKMCFAMSSLSPKTINDLTLLKFKDIRELLSIEEKKQCVE